MNWDLKHIYWTAALTICVAMLCITANEVSKHPFVFKIETDNNTVQIAQIAQNVSDGCPEGQFMTNENYCAYDLDSIGKEGFRKASTFFWIDNDCVTQGIAEPFPPIVFEALKKMGCIENSSEWGSKR